MQVRDPGQIRRWRKQRGYTQRELAMLVRRSQTAIYKVESGQLRNLSEAFAMAISNRLDVPWEDLFAAHEQTITPAVSTVRHAKSRHAVPA